MIFIIIMFWIKKKKFTLTGTGSTRVKYVGQPCGSTSTARVSNLGQLRGSMLTVWFNVNCMVQRELLGSTAWVKCLINCLVQRQLRGSTSAAWVNCPHRGGAELRSAQPHVVPHLIVLWVSQRHRLRRVERGPSPNARAALLLITR